jgi:polyhydroxyalkanoate synthase subunit PhaC
MLAIRFDGPGAHDTLKPIDLNIGSDKEISQPIGTIQRMAHPPQSPPKAPPLPATGSAAVPGSRDVPDVQGHDPEELAHNMMRVMQDGAKFYAGLLQRTEAQGETGGAAPELMDSTRTLAELTQAWMTDPATFAEAQSKLYGSYMDLWNGTMRRLMGEQVAPLAKPDPGDGRFKDAEWSSNPYFDYWKQAYLLSTKWAEQMLAQTPGLDDKVRQKADFLLRQYSASMSPSNFPVTNPEVMRETMASNGRNLVEGMQHLLSDMEKSGPTLKISQTDTTAFEVGRNLAMTPGKVVFQNDVLQLIQYTAATDQTHAIPLLIIPPWINKFYILDLTQPKSFIRYAVAQGFTVFIVSWVNPDQRLKSKTFEDYMREGILAATDAVMRETGARKINVVGYCVGGTLLAATLAYLAARGHEPFASATFLTTQVDFTKAGDLKLFIDDEQLKKIADQMAEKGYLEGARMASVFNMLRPKDLIWPYVVNNYMMGRKPTAFDLLYWNQDSTRMPEANHNFYLREFYHENKLATGQMALANTMLDLKKVTLPIYELAAKDDHIAPAESVFIGARMFGGPVEYVLAGSGHIAGVVNPPDPQKVKYQYWTNAGAAALRAETLADWMAAATETPGSWWPHWIAWLSAKSGEMVQARIPGAKLGVIEDAPGSYVKAKG